MTTPKTNWLPTDTYDVKVDFVRIFGNAVALCNVAQVYVDLWDTIALEKWTDELQKLWGPVDDSAAASLKTDWEYSDMIYQSYFTTLVGLLNYTAYSVSYSTLKGYMIPYSLCDKPTAALFNKIEILEREINNAI